MANNLFISYESSDRAAVDQAIKAVSPVWAHLETNFWFVSTPFSAVDVRNRIWAIMQPSDRLIVIDATHNQAAWQNLNTQIADYLKKNWERP